MRYVSLFSGVEAASVAWSRLGWEPLAFAEVAEFPAAVLAHRFPDVPNLGDVCKIDWKEFHEKHGAIDVLIGGSPCQSFSIAGGREGLEGESRLMFEYIRAVRDLVRASGGGSPRYIVWENVPGCLSSNKGRDFGCLLDELEDCGYFVAWRTLDSQFARVFDRASGRFSGPVPQRRRRVYLVGSLGGPSAADILIERTSMRGDHPSSREARQALARDSAECAGMGDIAVPVKADTTPKIGEPGDAAFTLRSRDSGGGINDIVAIQGDGSSSNGSQNGCGYNGDGSAYTLNGRDKQAVCIQGSMIGRADANGPNGGGVGKDVSFTLDTIDRHAVAFAQNTRDEVRLFGGDGQTVGALAAQPGMKQTSYVCMADDNAKAAVDEDLCGSLKVGGGCP